MKWWFSSTAPRVMTSWATGQSAFTPAFRWLILVANSWADV